MKFFNPFKSKEAADEISATKEDELLSLKKQLNSRNELIELREQLNNENELNIASITSNFVRVYTQAYKHNAQTLYNNGVLKTNPEAFSLLNTKDIKVYLLELNKLHFPTQNYYIVFIREINANLSINHLNLEDISLYASIDPLMSTADKISILINEKLMLPPKDILFYKEFYLRSYKKLPIDYAYLEPDDLDYFNSSVQIQLQYEASKFKNHINQPMNYYAKNAAKYTYSLLDLKPVIDLVNDEDFNYQLDQAIAAYDNSLYLASCATLGVCLESLCKLLLIRNGIKVKDSDATMLDKLSERLKHENIIDYKFKQRIDICYKIRNIASHTSPGKVVQQDCHNIISTIHELVGTYFTKLD